ncbi:MAG: response regulator [Candidatus Aminicenantes bacterium]|jgi:DNA-binding response OmpR family regulator
MDNTELNKQKKPIVFIVDDVPKNLQVLGNTLRNRDYNISVATSGEQALNMMDKILPDLILLDVVMPGIDGFKVCKKLKTSEKTKDIPIIFLTAKTQTEDIVKGFELGAVDYVTKPFNKEELLARVHTQLALRNARKEIVGINQPLTAVKDNCELFLGSIDKKSLTGDQKNYLAKVKEGIEKIQTILKKFTD